MPDLGREGWGPVSVCRQPSRLKRSSTHACSAGFGSPWDDEEGPPRLLEVKDGIGTSRSMAPWRNRDVWSNEMSGITGYPEIRNAMVTAANDPEVKHILLDINSGGETVSVWTTRRS